MLGVISCEKATSTSSEICLLSRGRAGVREDLTVCAMMASLVGRRVYLVCMLCEGVVSGCWSSDQN